MRKLLSFRSSSSNNVINDHAPSPAPPDILVGHSKAKRGEALSARKKYGTEKVESPCLSNSIDSKRDSSHGSPQANSAGLVHVSNNVSDLYIDEEQNQHMNLRTSRSSFRCHSDIAVGGRQPPRILTTSPVSPRDMRKHKGRSQSFGDNHLRLSAREGKSRELGSEWRQKFARDVAERLLSQVFSHKPKTRSCDLDPDTPTTVEDDIPYDSMTGFAGEGGKDFSDGRFSVADASVSMYLDQEDVGLHKYADEAQERHMRISEEIEQDALLKNRDFSVSESFQTIRSLSEKRSLAEEGLTQTQCRISDRESAREACREEMVEIDPRKRRLEGEKMTLEQELDRRSSDWSFKLEKYQSEEQRLHELVRELTEKNVSLQREVSASNVKEAENRNQMANAEVQLKDLTAKLEETTKENSALQQNLSKLHDQCKAAENDRDCIRQSYKTTENDMKELQKTVARLQRTCREQDSTIECLRQGLVEDVERQEHFDYDANRWKMEQVRSMDIEPVLRREVESYRLKVESIRHENMNLLDRLNNSGIEGGSAGFRLEQELKDRISCLQKQGLSLFDESCQLCEKLLGFIKGETDTNAGKIQEVGKDGYFIVEAHMKVQKMKRGLKNLALSLQSVSLVLEDKSNTENDSSAKLKYKASEDDTTFKLKAETLLTTLLREKLLSKQQEVEQLQAEVATAARGHDILRSEVQGAQDSLSRAYHQMNDLKLKFMKKEDMIHQLTSELQQCEKELASVKGYLRNMAEERDICWEEVMNYNEKNMGLNREVNMLRKKVKSLDEMNMLLNKEVNMLRKQVNSLEEDVYTKEGQMAILRDSFSTRKPLYL